MNARDSWYLAIEGKTEGPFSRAQVEERIRAKAVGGQTYAYAAGMVDWEPIERIPEFQGSVPGARAEAPPPQPPRALAGRPRADEIEYEIFGEEMQFVEITLDPGEAAIAEAGAFMYMDPGIQMQTIFGDGSQQAGSGFLGKLMSAGKRVITGESLFMTLFGNGGGTRQKVAFASPYPGRILPLDLTRHDRVMLCQKDAFLCAAKGVSVGIAFQRKLGTGLFGGEGFILQRLEGDGLAFVHAGGHVVARDLGPGETIRLDTGCLVALEPRVNYDIQFVGGVKTALFGGEGLFFATLTGPGRVFIQSLPFSRLASRIYAAAPQTPGGRRVGEGSILGGLGNLLDGD